MACERPDLAQLLPRHKTAYISENRTVLITGRDGLITDEKEHGLFAQKTRVLSRYRYLINGEPPQDVTNSPVAQHSWLGYYIAPARPGAGQAAQHAVELRVSRFVGDGCHEDLDLVNYTGQKVSLTLEIELDADFADQQEISGKRQQKGKQEQKWRDLDGGGGELVFDYRAEHAYDHHGEKGTASIHDGLTVRIERADSTPSYRHQKISFAIHLAPLETWHACLSFIPLIEDQELLPLYRCGSFHGIRNDRERKRRVFISRATSFAAPGSDTLTPLVLSTLEQARRDLAAMRLYDHDQGDEAWTMAAGLPVYVGLFGRDALITSWQAALISPAPMLGTLGLLAKTQSHETDDWRDAQPGRMIHQIQDGPLAALNYNPFRRYYGDLSAPVFYCELVVALWLWTGDLERVRRYLDPALKALRWLDEYADPHGDKLYAYQTRSEKGLQNQFWKDSSDSTVCADGSLAPQPVAACELQGLAYLVKDQLAVVLDWLGDREQARHLHAQALEQKKRFNDLFWMDEEGYYAMGLDCHRQQIRSITSDPGACLAAGIVDQDRALQTADRLMASDLFSGWGVRTLSARHPSYNPFSYQRGSVWPVENGILALGLGRYGLHDHVERLCRAQFEAAGLFEHHRLPEVFSGHARDTDHPFPALYPKTNWPQAWSSSAVFSFLQALLGIFPFAPLETLVVDPHLPEWLPEITLRDLRVGGAVASIRFYRKPGGSSSYEVLDMRGRLHVLCQPSPWSLTASAKERVMDVIASLLPGKH
jgi:glycogen debranching enzyme